VLSVDVSRPIPESYLARVASLPGVERVEVYIQSFAQWVKPTGGAELCIVIGARLEDDAMGYLSELTPQLRTLLTEPGAIVVDESELDRLSIQGIGATGEILGHRVRVVGFVRGLKSIAGPYIFCSVQTARTVTRLPPEQESYVLAKCRTPADAQRVVERLRGTPNLSAFTAGEFSRRSQIHWLTKTKAGIALGYAALLGLLVGTVVTSQTLYAATAASMREYAVLQALGIPRWRMAAAVMSQSFWVGLSGVALALPAVFGFAEVANRAGARVLLPWWLLLGAAVVTLAMAVLAGLLALRSLRLVEPAVLLR
jgi:putative ABC transport system permease protein